MGENRVLTPAKVGARCYSTFEPASSNFCMTIDVFVLQIMISGEIQAVNIGNTRLVPGFPQGSNSLEKASARLVWTVENTTFYERRPPALTSGPRGGDEQREDTRGEEAGGCRRALSEAGEGPAEDAGERGGREAFRG